MNSEAIPRVPSMLERVMLQVAAAAQSGGSRLAATAKRNVTPTLDQNTGWSLPGISGHVRVTTVFGEIPVQQLCVGDHLKTRSGRFSPIEQIKVTDLDWQFIQRHPDALPVLIQQGALDNNLPKHDVLLSPAQLVTLRTGLNPPKRVLAKNLINSIRLLCKSAGRISYFEIRLKSEDDVCCEGVWVKLAAVQ